MSCLDLESRSSLYETKGSQALHFQASRAFRRLMGDSFEFDRAGMDPITAVDEAIARSMSANLFAGGEG